MKLFLANIGYHTRVFPLVTPPMGVMSLAAYLRRELSVEPMIVNQRLENCPPEEVVRRAVAFGADAVGFSMLTTSSYLLPEVVRLTRQALPKALILAGGPHASSAKEAVMAEAAVDVVVPGEGELATKAVLQAWREGGRDFGGIPGVIWRDANGEVVVNPGPVELVEDLDALPMPAYDLIDLPAYWRAQSIAPVFRRRYASLNSSRGCPYGCIWCHKTFGRSIRVNSPERILEEMSHLSKTYGINDFEFLDDNFNFHPRRVMDFCDLAGRAGFRPRMAFPYGIRADLLDDAVIDALVGAGMYQCSVAMDTASPRLQKYTGKNMRVEMLLAAGERMTARRVYSNLFCMLGFPTETEEELRLTISTACASPFHTASFYTVTPFPGTALHDIVKREHPEKLARLRYDNMDISGMRVNLTDLPDATLFHHQRRALRQFYASPRRLARLARSHPQPWLLPAFLPILLYRATKGLLPSAAACPDAGGCAAPPADAAAPPPSGKTP